MDYVTDLPVTPSQLDSILVVVDRLTKMVTLIPTTKQVTAVGTFSLLMQHVFARHGVPREIVSDRDPRFTSTAWRDATKALGIDLAMSTAFHPQTDGQTERTNRTVEQILRMYINPTQDNWDTLLPLVEYAINSAPNESTLRSPFEANYGYNPASPFMRTMDNLVNNTVSDYVAAAQRTQKEIIKHIEVAKLRSKATADKHRQESHFNVGDHVLLSTKNLTLPAQACKKLKQRFIGPFKVLQRRGQVAYELDLPAEWKICRTFHVDLLKSFNVGPHSASQQPLRPPPVIINDQEEYYVDDIVGERLKNGARQFLVRWRGYGPEEDSWEPEDALQEVDALDRWEARRLTRKRPTRRGRRF